MKCEKGIRERGGLYLSLMVAYVKRSRSERKKRLVMGRLLNFELK